MKQVSLPHQAPALVVEGLLDADDLRGTVLLRIPHDWSLLIGERCPAVLGVELLGQAVAAWAARRRDDRAGVIVRCRGVRLHVAELPIGAPLHADVVQIHATAGGASGFDVHVAHDGRPLIDGRILVQRLGGT